MTDATWIPYLVKWKDLWAVELGITQIMSYI